MLKIRKSSERGYFDHGWLKTFHTFSFADYHDSNHVHFRNLRVINEDTIAEGVGFPTHGHRDMEIITYVYEGSLAHKDSTGNEEVIRPGEMQRMTAGSGIHHSEFNFEKNKETKLLQIWIFPEEKNLTPGYEQKKIPDGKFELVVSPKGDVNILKIHQDVSIYVGKFQTNDAFNFKADEKRFYWLQLIKGELLVNNTFISEGDGLEISLESSLNFNSKTGCEFLFFDLN